MFNFFRAKTEKIQSYVENHYVIEMPSMTQLAVSMGGIGLGYLSLATGVIRNIPELMELNSGEVLDLNSTDEALVYGGLTLGLASCLYLGKVFYDSFHPINVQEPEIPPANFVKNARG